MGVGVLSRTVFKKLKYERQESLHLHSNLDRFWKETEAPGVCALCEPMCTGQSALLLIAVRSDRRLETTSRRVSRKDRGGIFLIDIFYKSAF